MAALLWSAMQAVARRAAEAKGVSLPYPNGRRQTDPTAKWIKELLEPEAIVRCRWNGVRYRAVNKLTWVQRLACLLIPPPRLAEGASGSLVG